MIRIVTDSSSDISPSLAAELGITVIPIRIRFGSKVYHDGVDLDRNEFYRHFTTAAVTPSAEPPLLQDFQRVYNRLLKGSDQVLAIHVSSKMNRAAQVAREAARSFLGQDKITVVDSRMISWGLRQLVVLAVEAAQRRASAPEIVRLIRGIIPHIYMVFYTENANYWERHRARPRDRALTEGVPGFKPLLIVEEGEIVPMERVRSRGKSVDRLHEFLAEFARFEQATVLQGHLADDAHLLFEQLVEAFPENSLNIQPYGPTLATYLGPSALGLGVYEGL
jgi:DegV family protein with EDD domain